MGRRSGHVQFPHIWMRIMLAKVQELPHAPPRHRARLTRYSRRKGAPLLQGDTVVLALKHTIHTSKIDDMKATCL